MNKQIVAAFVASCCLTSIAAVAGPSGGSGIEGTPKGKRLSNLAAFSKDSMPIRRIENGEHSGITSATTKTISNNTDWLSFWKQHKSGETPMPAAPNVNFEKERVVAVFAGQKSSGGYTIKIESAKDNGKNIVLDIEQSIPPSGSMTASVMTQPYEIVALPAGSKPVVRNDIKGKAPAAVRK